MLSYAILIDGGFLKRKLGTPKAPTALADIQNFLNSLKRAPALASMRLHRVYFYDSQPRLSQSGLGELVGVTDQAIAKWEKTGKVPKTADRMIRLIYLEDVSENVKIRSTIESILNTDAADSTDLVAEEQSDGWKIAA